MALIKDQQLSCSHAATPEMRFTDWVSGGSDAGDTVLAKHSKYFLFVLEL